MKMMGGMGEMREEEVEKEGCRSRGRWRGIKRLKGEGVGVREVG